MTGEENGTIDGRADALSDALDRASDESSIENLTAFYELLLHSDLHIPERTQEQPLSQQPRYPNEFLNILGVQNKETVFVPVFSSAEAAEEWSGQKLRLRIMRLSDLLNLVPDGWWLILNPGSESEKDISSWEIDLLKGGAQSIPALVDELLVEEAVHDVELQPLAPERFPQLMKALTDVAGATPEVKKLFLLQETGKTVSEKSVSALILGVLIAPEGMPRREEIQDALSDAGALSLIGAERLKVRCGDSVEGNLMLGIFAGHTPFYTRDEKSWISRILKR